VIKKLIKSLCPKFVLQARANYLHIKRCKEQDSITPKEAFTEVYLNNFWGHSANSADTYYSGTGSHNELIVSTYVNAVKDYLSSYNHKLDVADLGCGDFAVGSKIRDFCGLYIACDVVEPLIEHNRDKFKELNVDFRILDLTTDNLPNGEVVFLRQVLQHLSNKQIMAILSKLQNQYKYLIITEHLPLSDSFIANLDKPAGPDIRLGVGHTGSGVVITAHPFNFKFKTQRVLCEVKEHGGVIRTIVYELL
jgi:hypothetical protein